MAAAVQPIDLDNPGQYPVYLSDALLGKGTKDVFTSVRYDKKPTPSPDSSLSAARIKSSGRADKFDLTFFDDENEEYSYQGTRSSSDDQYVLVFDPARKAFILHQVDSTFDMKLAKTSSGDQNAPTARAKPGRKKATTATDTGTKAANKKKQQVQEKPKKSKPPPREVTPDEAEDEDSDDGLLVEYPDSQPPPHYRSRPMSSLLQREPSDVESVEGESDADYEEEAIHEPDEDIEAFKLPSPVQNGGGNSFEDDMEDDLEAALVQALEEKQEDESSESEEE